MGVITPYRVRIGVAAFILSACVLIVVGLLATNYAAAMLFVGSIWLVISVRILATRIDLSEGAKRLVATVRRPLFMGLLLVACVLGSLISMAVAFFLIAAMGGASVEPPSEVVWYELKIEPSQSSEHTFVVKERAIVSPTESLLSGLDTGRIRVTWPERTVSSTPKGFLLREVSVKPSDEARIPLEGDDSAARGLTSLEFCFRSCAENTISLRKFPKGSFVDTRNPEDLNKPDEYNDEETIEWSSNELDDEINFVYIPAPFHRFRPLLEPFVGAETLGDWIFILLGIIGGVAYNLLKPVVDDWISDKVKGWFKGLGGKKRRGYPDPQSEFE